MITAWFQHLKTKEEQEAFKSSVNGSKRVLDRLDVICKQMDSEALALSNDYDNPNWAYRQADVNGYRRALREIHKLINLDQKE